jgi:hypothetical protein
MKLFCHFYPPVILFLTIFQKVTIYHKLLYLKENLHWGIVKMDAIYKIVLFIVVVVV